MDKKDFLSGVRNNKNNDLKLLKLKNNNLVVNNGYFVYENEKHYLFSNIVIQTFSGSKGDYFYLNNFYDFNSSIFIVRDKSDILQTDDGQKYINIENCLNYKFHIDFDGKKYKVVLDDDLPGIVYFLYNNPSDINIPIRGLDNYSLILGEILDKPSSLSIDKLNNIKSNYTLFSNVTNEQGLFLKNIPVLWYKISTVYEANVVFKENLTTVTTLTLIGATGNNVLIVTNIDFDFSKLKIGDKISGIGIPNNTIITEIDSQNSTITISNNLTNNTLGYYNVFRLDTIDFFDKILDTDNINYWTGIKKIGLCDSDSIGNSFINFSSHPKEDKIFIFSAIKIREDKYIQSDLYWINEKIKESEHISEDSFLLDNPINKLSSQEALCAMGLDPWLNFWAEDKNALLNINEENYFVDRKDWRKKYYFLERPPINDMENRGEGTLSRPFKISNAKDLSLITGDYYYILVNDIDLTDYKWNPISNFNGQLDGQNHSIIQLNINKSDEDNVGLFANLNGTVKNLTIKTNIDGYICGHNYVGILAGNSDNAIIEKVSCYGNVKGVNFVGGIVGKSNNLSIKNSSFEGNINQEIDNYFADLYVGGITSYSSANSLFSNLYTKGNINTIYKNLNGYNFVGGIVGYLLDDVNVVNYEEKSKYLISSIKINNFSPNTRTVFGGIFGYSPLRAVKYSNFIYLGDNIDNVLYNNMFGNYSSKLIGWIYGVNLPSQFQGYSLDSILINNSVVEENSINGYNKNLDFFTNIDNYTNLTFDTVLIWKSTSLNGNYKGFPIFVWQTDNIPDEEDGSEEKPFHINNIDDLKKLRDRVNLGVEPENCHYVMTRDITMSLNFQENWKPIGTVDDPFKGHFNGANKKILNFNNEITEENVFGLFGYISNATISNLTLKGDISHSISAENATTSLLCAYVENSTITSCNVYGNVICNSNDRTYFTVGLICAFVTDSQIIQCSNYNCKINIESKPKADIGGIVGNSTVSTISACVSCVDINNGYNAGGICGISSNTIIEQCQSSADIKNIKENVGGIAGKFNGVMSKCLYLGKKISGYRNVGGSVGNLLDGSTYNNNEVLGTTIELLEDESQNIAFVGGLVGKAESNISLSFFRGSFIDNTHIENFVSGIASHIGVSISQCYCSIISYRCVSLNSKIYRIAINTNKDNYNLMNNYAEFVPLSMSDDMSINDNPSSQSILAENNVKGKSLENSEMVTQNTYEFDFDNIWNMSAQNIPFYGYPILKMYQEPVSNNSEETLYESVPDEELGKWNFHDYYLKYLQEPNVSLNEAKTDIGNYMSCAYQGFLGHFKLSGQDILDMTQVDASGYLIHPTYKAIQEANNTQLNLSDCILNKDHDFYTISYNLIPRSDNMFHTENLEAEIVYLEGDRLMLDFTRNYSTYYKSPLNYKDLNNITQDKGGTNSQTDLTISPVTYIDALGSYNSLYTRLLIGHHPHPECIVSPVPISGKVAFSNLPPSYNELKYVFYIPKKVINVKTITKEEFFELILTDKCYFRGLAVMMQFCFFYPYLEGGYEMQHPYMPYESNFTLIDLISNYKL